MDKNINWNATRRNSIHTNTVESCFLTSQIWINDFNDIANSIEVIELDTMNNTTSPQEPYENIQNTSQAWSYVDNNRFQELEDDYKVNRQARLRRRLRNRNHFTPDDSFDSEFEEPFFIKDTDCKNISTEFKDDVTFNQQTNCFTILNRRSTLMIDSSSENSEDIEPTRCGDVVLEREWNDDEACVEVNYNNDQEDKRTIWIYSFKNRRMLPENDFGLINIPSQSGSCSTSCFSGREDEETSVDNVTHVGRVASPIPKAYIPRLDLSLGATLPNVTEVTEPKSMPIKQKRNGWLLENNPNISKEGKSTDIVNWMALSPRERRRRSRHTNSDAQNMPQLLPLKEIVSHSEGNFKNRHLDAEIIEENVMFKEPLEINVIDPPGTKTIDCTMGDRGDYKKCVPRPRIKVDNKPMLSSSITEPIEKLDSHNWIAEHEPIMTYKCDIRPDDESNRGANPKLNASAGDRLVSRNMSLLKPAEWKAYSPIAGSRLSIQISIEADSVTETTNFFQRCVNCFRCCKYRF